MKIYTETDFGLIEIVKEKRDDKCLVVPEDIDRQDLNARVQKIWESDIKEAYEYVLYLERK